ncbi:MAG: Na+/H+ antiporter subunit E [Thioalkalispiraceae bacterium]|jgi:multicomponent Na+:H+ antiporter subunit E
MRTIISTILIFLFWVLLSGHFEPLLLVLGVISTLLTIYIAQRMHVIDQESYPVQQLARLLRFYLFLGKEIILANLDVIKRILKPGPSISPQVIQLPAKQHSDLAKVIYANSITLTPGTVTLDLSGNELKVHALSQEAADDLLKERIANAVPDKKGTPSR